MYSGKTQEAIRLCKRYKSIEKKVLIVNHSLDDRYSKELYIVSHDGVKEECLKTDTLLPILEISKYIEADVVIIEEAQFFPDLLEFVGTRHMDKDFIVVGLSGDYQMNPIGDVLSLISKADYIEKLLALCKYCGNGTAAPFTKKINGSNEIVQVGATDLYVAVCKHHYFN